MAPEAGFAADPAERVTVTGERLVLSPEAPDRWISGTQLRGTLGGLLPGTGLPVHHAIDPDSVVVRHQGRTLEAGRDYIADPVWGSLGIGPDPTFPPDDEVEVDYRFSLLRLDSIVEGADGTQRLVRGESHLSVPVPPPIGPGERRIANLFVNYHDDSGGERFDVLEPPEAAVTKTRKSRLRRALAILRSGGRLRVVCWGDSLTAGGEASSPELAFPHAFGAELQRRWPDAEIDLKVVAVGGTNTGQWLGVTELPDVFDPAEVRYQRVVDAQPDVLVIEFVNDAGFPMETLRMVHAELVARVGELGCEVILVVGHFTMADLMGTDDLRTEEVRPQMLALYDLADEQGWALADVSSRWAHLWREGIPHVTLLVNGINHPDDRGHRLFTEELLACFDEA